MFRIGVATLTGVLAFLVLEKVFLKNSNPHLFPFPGKPPNKLLLHQGVGDEQPRDEPGAPREGEQEDRRLPQLARQLHRQPIAWACGIIVIIIIDRHQGYLNLPSGLLKFANCKDPLLQELRVDLSNFEKLIQICRLAALFFLPHDWESQPQLPYFYMR